jgi:hypothetical protein
MFSKNTGDEVNLINRQSRITVEIFSQQSTSSIQKIGIDESQIIKSFRTTEIAMVDDCIEYESFVSKDQDSMF